MHGSAELFDALRWALTEVIEGLSESLGFAIWKSRKATPWTLIRDFMAATEVGSQGVEVTMTTVMGSPSLRIVLAEVDKRICGCYALMLGRLLSDRGAHVEICGHRLLNVWAKDLLLDEYGEMLEQLSREVYGQQDAGSAQGEDFARNFARG